MSRFPRMGSSLALSGAVLLLSAGVFAAPRPYSAPQEPDNSRTNKGDASKGATTADQQKMNPNDRTITQKIRAEVMKDKSLSTYAHNLKIITRDGKVTLKGPVRTQEEKATIEEKATAIAGDGNVTSEIEVAPPKP